MATERWIFRDWWSGGRVLRSCSIFRGDLFTGGCRNFGQLHFWAANVSERSRPTDRFLALLALALAFALRFAWTIEFLALAFLAFLAGEFVRFTFFFLQQLFRSRPAVPERAPVSERRSVCVVMIFSLA